jgi:hypothetical protein
VIRDYTWRHVFNLKVHNLIILLLAGNHIVESNPGSTSTLTNARLKLVSVIGLGPMMTLWLNEKVTGVKRACSYLCWIRKCALLLKAKRIRQIRANTTYNAWCFFKTIHQIWRLYGQLIGLRKSVLELWCKSDIQLVAATTKAACLSHWPRSCTLKSSDLI